MDETTSSDVTDLDNDPEHEPDDESAAEPKATGDPALDNAPDGDETPREFIERVTPSEPEPEPKVTNLFDPEKVDETPDTDVEHQADKS